MIRVEAWRLSDGQVVQGKIEALDIETKYMKGKRKELALNGGYASTNDDANTLVDAIIKNKEVIKGALYLTSDFPSKNNDYGVTIDDWGCGWQCDCDCDNSNDYEYPSKDKADDALADEIDGAVMRSAVRGFSRKRHMIPLLELIAENRNEVFGLVRKIII